MVSASALSRVGHEACCVVLSLPTPVSRLVGGFPDPMLTPSLRFTSKALDPAILARSIGRTVF
ncbi:hypothetical protein CC86DRAFT_39402 [Ophiobolus disseminans]|uniref:Uncharacterized protein n=1 Tax=Ophiobolus disseminans TaxID=1469910 RepID=A0A6A6ZWB8_9PLEO|nr:hypothetical protein CC86DRAFT_39402 [Ophiobolus disseminans]